MLISKMAAEGGGKEMNEIKTQFTTREGVYKLLTHSEYSRPNRVPFNSQGSNPVKVSFVNVNDQSGNGDRICFNVGRELYFYIYKGVRKVNFLLKLSNVLQCLYPLPRLPDIFITSGLCYLTCENFDQNKVTATDSTVLG